MDLGQYFVKDYTGSGFILFGTAHLVTLLVIVLFILFLMRFKGTSEETRLKVRWSLAIVLWLVEGSWHIWNIAIGTWTIQTMLPLHMCSVLIWLTGFMLIFKKYSIYEFVYFLGIGGALQALLTPDVGIYGFPHFRAFQVMVSHGSIVTASVYMTAVEGFRPTWQSLKRVLIGGNIYMAVIFVLNLIIGSNYLFIAHKPATASVIDLLPPWPYYIIFIELMGVVMSLILYLPFLIGDWARRKAT